MKHTVLTLVWLVLYGLAVFVALKSEFRRKGEGEPEFVMVYAYMGWRLLLPAALGLMAGFALFCFLARNGVNARWRRLLMLCHLPLLLLSAVTLLVASGAVWENLWFIPVILLDLGRLAYVLFAFPRPPTTVVTA
ncbi:MAG: hypothetical protein P0Y51_00500 [Candidatus Pseudomonas colombiensis]|nr:MAG: hypothetical protein P0Y51_00500 [Pseudomonas sp.]